MSWKNTLIKGVVFLLKKRKTTTAIDNFLIVSTTGLGDTLWGTPAIRALKESFPDATITALTTPLGKETLKNNPHINNFITLTDSLLSFIRPFFNLRKNNFSAALFFHTSQRMVLPMVAACGIPSRIGYEGLNKGLDSLLTKVVKKKVEHEIARRLSLVKEAGATVKSPLLEMHWEQEDEQAMKTVMSASGACLDLPCVALHPGAKDQFKQYPPKAFVKIGKELQKRLKCQILITGSQREKNLVDSIANEIPGAIAIAGNLSIASLSSLISKLSLFITNDTGPMHIAFATKTPTIALFGPTDPFFCGPFFAKNHKILKTSKTCLPCIRKKCKQPFCLMQIPISDIITSALELYGNK